MTKKLFVFVLFSLSFILSTIAYAGYSAFAVNKTDHVLSVGTRLHMDHSVFESLPFSDDDLTYLVTYEFHEGEGLWQLGLGYTPEPGKDTSVDAVWTPQVNLIFKDRFWRGGIGVLTSYIESDKDNQWMDLYWQFIVGIHIPFSWRIGLDVNSYYVFEDWGKIGKFDGRDIEFGVLLNFKF